MNIAHPPQVRNTIPPAFRYIEDTGIGYRDPLVTVVCGAVISVPTRFGSTLLVYADVHNQFQYDVNCDVFDFGNPWKAAAAAAAKCTTIWRSKTTLKTITTFRRRANGGDGRNGRKTSNQKRKPNSPTRTRTRTHLYYKLGVY